MEIVINNQHGGFSLSPKATKRLAELNGKSYFFFKGGLSRAYEEITMEEAEKEFMWNAFTINDAKEINSIFGEVNWHELNQEEKDTRNKRYKEIDLYCRDIARDDKNLIKVVKELKKQANGKCAALKVVKIPDGVEYQIEEYDGLEWVSEKHRTWN